MRFIKFFSLLALAAGMFVSCGEGDVTDIASYTSTLTVVPGSRKIAADGKASFTFKLAVSGGLNNQVQDISKFTGTVSFSAAGGTVSPESATTDASGNITVVFTAPNPESFEGGSVTGVLKKVQEEKDGGLFQQGDLSTATATVLPLNAEEPVDDSPIKKALELRDNTYSVQKKGGEVHVYELPQEYSEWYMGPSYMDRTKQVVHVNCMDEDEDLDTKGWLSGEIPPEIVNKLTTINQEFNTKYPWASAKMVTFRQGNNIGAHVGEGGNVKLDGSSQIWLREKSGTKAYSGQYQLLSVYVFEEQAEEYTICVNATLDELVADLSYFHLYPSDDWVVPGQSVTLTAEWTAGASFDWSKVTLDSQVCNGNSGQWFSWDASTQKITATQSADNQEIKLTFGYAGTDKTEKISLYCGPGYTSFSLSPQNGSQGLIVVENDSQVWSGYDLAYITVDSFTPDDYYSFNYHSIEIDPASDYYDKLDYNYYGPYVEFKNTIPEGDFKITLRSKADHSVKCTLPVKMVMHKPRSFTITYLHNSDYIHDDNIHGVCNYPMGLSLGVITDPADAWWSWNQVELAYDYDGFSFSGVGGKDDHPKLQRTKSNPSGDTSYGTQIVFRLKYDHRRTSTIYVDHN